MAADYSKMSLEDLLEVRQHAIEQLEAENERKAKHRKYRNFIGLKNGSIYLRDDGADDPEDRWWPLTKAVDEIEEELELRLKSSPKWIAIGERLDRLRGWSDDRPELTE